MIGCVEKIKEMRADLDSLLEKCELTKLSSKEIVDKALEIEALLPQK